MKTVLLILFCLPVFLLAQPEDPSLMGPVVPDVDSVSIDLNQDGIADLSSVVYAIGTDDVPSSSGVFFLSLVPAPHCSLMADPQSFELKWFDSLDPDLPVGSYVWEHRISIELMSVGYGHAATAGGWQILLPEGKSCVGFRISNGDGEVEGIMKIQVSGPEPKVEVVAISYYP